MFEKLFGNDKSELPDEELVNPYEENAKNPETSGATNDLSEEELDKIADDVAAQESGSGDDRSMAA